MSEETTPVVNQEEETVYDRFEGPFDAVAYLLMLARLGMEKSNFDGELPRYVRIARAQHVLEDQSTSWIQAPAKLAIYGVKGLNIFMAKMITLTLDAKDLLKGTDAIMALSEVALEMIDVLISDQFWTAFGDSFEPIIENSGDDAPVVIPSDTVVSSFRNSDFDLPKIKKWLKVIPDPEDLERVGHELYRMCCLVYGEDKSMSVTNSGKLRVLQYMFGHDWEVTHAKKGTSGGMVSTDVNTKVLGQYLSEAKFSTSVPRLKYESPDGTAIELFKPEGDPTTEVDNVLKSLKYVSGDPLDRIKVFQKENDLATNGKLDQPTINRFFNLDTERKNVIHAKDKASGNPAMYPIGFIHLVNANADGYDAEGLTPTLEGESKYRFYELRTESIFPTDGPYTKGWQRKSQGEENGVKYVHGFVAIESRFVDLSRKKDGTIYEGGNLSEGEAADGRFFFCARHVEPWRPGRNGVPKSSLIYDNPEKAPDLGSVSQMFQLIEVDVLEFLHGTEGTQKMSEYNLSFEAYCLRRSLYTDRVRSGALLNQPDQGRILLEISKDGDKENEPTWSDPKVKSKEGWEPSAGLTRAIARDSQINQRNNWFRQTSGLRVMKAVDLLKENPSAALLAKLPKDIVAADLAVKKLKFKVSLEGRYRSGWDIDAYFDEVKLKWMLTKI